MLTGHRLPHWFRFRNVPVQVVVTLLGILCWVGETEIKDKLRIRAIGICKALALVGETEIKDKLWIRAIGICEALALEWETMTGRA